MRIKFLITFVLLFLVIGCATTKTGPASSSPVLPSIEPGVSVVTPTPGLSGSGGGVIAYGFAQTSASGRHQINFINLDGSGDRQFVEYPIGLNHPDWSPDGQKLAMVGYMDNTYTTWSIHVFNADGSNPVRLTAETGAADSEPTWSPDGQRILFTRIDFTSSNQFNSSLWLTNADGSAQRMVVADGFVGKWSPDGMRIIYSSNKTGNHEIYTATPDGTNEIRLTFTDTNESYPEWSPDGSQIAFSVSAGEWNSNASLSTYEIEVMNADGSDLRLLTDNDSFDGMPRWSPDGSQIVFSSDRDEAEHFDIYVMNADGSDVRQVTHTPEGTTAINPVWRP